MGRYLYGRQIPCGISLIHLVRFPICACKAPTHVNRMSLCQIRAIFSVSPAPFHFRRAQLASASAYMGMKRKVPRINIISAFPNIASCLKNRPAYRGRQSTITAFLAQSNLKHTRNIRDDTISVLYINGVALSARMYETLKRSLSLFAENGTLSVSNISLATHA